MNVIIAFSCVETANDEEALVVTPLLVVGTGQ